MSSSPYKVSSEVARGEGDWAAVPVFVREAIVEALMHSYSPNNVNSNINTIDTTHKVITSNTTPVRGESVSSHASCPMPAPFLTEEQIQQSVQTFADAAHIRTAAVRSFGEFHNTIENLHVKLNPSLRSLWKTSMQLEESIMKRVQQSCNDTAADVDTYHDDNYINNNKTIPDNVLLTKNEIIKIRKEQVVLEKLVQQMEELRNASIVFAAYYLSDAEKWAMGTNPQYLRPEEVERALQLKTDKEHLHRSRPTQVRSRRSHRDHEASYESFHDRANKFNTSSNVNNKSSAKTHHKVEEVSELSLRDNDNKEKENIINNKNNYTTPNAVSADNIVIAAAKNTVNKDLRTKNLPSRTLRVPPSSATSSTSSSSSSSSSSFQSEAIVEDIPVNSNNIDMYNNNTKEDENGLILSTMRTKPTNVNSFTKAADVYTLTSSHHNHPHEHHTHSHHEKKYPSVSKAIDHVWTDEQTEPHERTSHSVSSEQKPIRRRRVVVRRVRRHASARHDNPNDYNIVSSSAIN